MSGKLAKHWEEADLVRLRTNINTGQEVALKFIKKNEIMTNGKNINKKPNELNKFIVSEIKSLQRMNHKNIIKLLAYNLNAFDDLNGLTVLLIFGFAPYGELFDLLKNTHCFDMKISQTYLEQIISAVKACHSMKPYIIHRDLKPQNVLIVCVSFLDLFCFCFFFHLVFFMHISKLV